MWASRRLWSASAPGSVSGSAPGAVRRWGLALACAVPLVAGCATPVPAGDPDDAFTPSGSAWDSVRTTSSPPVPPQRDSRSPALDDGERRSVEDAVAAYWKDIQHVAARPRKRDPRLARHATGRALAQWQRTIATLAGRKQRYGGRVDQQVSAATVRGRAATAVGCVDGTAWVLLGPKGQRAGRPRPATTYAYRLVKTGRTWRVSTQAPRGTCGSSGP
jgi:hypothetical protein